MSSPVSAPGWFHTTNQLVPSKAASGVSRAAGPVTVVAPDTVGAAPAGASPATTSTTSTATAATARTRTGGTVAPRCRSVPAMKVDGGLPFELDKAAGAASEAEGRGYDAVWT